MFRIIQTLAKAGWVEENRRGSKSWSVTSSIARKFATAVAPRDFSDLVHEELLHLREATGESIHVCLPSDGGLTVVQRLEGTRSVRTSLSLGTRVPLDVSASGRAYLAACRSGTWEDQLSATDAYCIEPVNIELMAAELRQVQTAGYARNHARWRPEISAIAAAVAPEPGEPIATIAVSFAKQRYEEDTVESFAVSLMSAAERVVTSLRGF